MTLPQQLIVAARSWNDGDIAGIAQFGDLIVYEILDRDPSAPKRERYVIAFPDTRSEHGWNGYDMYLNTLENPHHSLWIRRRRLRESLLVLYHLLP